MYEVEYDLDGNGALGVNPAWCGKPDGVSSRRSTSAGSTQAVNAFNPCAPDMGSRSCPTRIPF